jgi:hypothetical protein
MSVLAACADPPFPRGSEGSLRGGYSGSFFDNGSFSDRWACWKTLIKLSLHSSDGDERKCYLSRETWLIFWQSNGLVQLPRRTRPYRSKWIITVLRDLYFTGRTRSFACRNLSYVPFIHLRDDFSLNVYYSRFPTYQNCDGVRLPEVPIPMVALVSTAVSTSVYSIIFHWHIVLVLCFYPRVA